MTYFAIGRSTAAFFEGSCAETTRNPTKHVRRLLPMNHWVVSLNEGCLIGVAMIRKTYYLGVYTLNSKP